MKVIKPVDLFAFIVSLITFTSLLILFILKEVLSRIIRSSRVPNSLDHRFSFKDHLTFSLFFITFPNILHFFSLPSIKSDIALICGPYGIIILYLFLLFNRYIYHFTKYQSTFLIILFFSFFILLGQFLYRTINEESPIFSLFRFFCFIFQNGIFLIMRYSFHSLNVSDFILISLNGSFFSTIYFLLSSILLKKCELQDIKFLLYQMINFTKTWPYLSALLRNITGLNFYLFLVKRKSNLIEFVPYLVFFSGFAFSIFILEEWESIESYEKIMRTLSIFLNIFACIIHILSFCKNREKKTSMTNKNIPF